MEHADLVVSTAELRQNQIKQTGFQGKQKTIPGIVACQDEKKGVRERERERQRRKKERKNVQNNMISKQFQTLL